MKKRFFIPTCLLTAAAIGFVIYAVGHPELSFPWSIQITHILCGLYVDAVMLLFVLAFWKKTDRSYLLAIILGLGAVFFLVQSMLTVFPEGKSNWYLPLALGLNCIALFLNAVQRRKQQRKDESKNEKEEKHCDRMQHRFCNLFRDRQLEAKYAGTSGGKSMNVTYEQKPAMTFEGGKYAGYH